MTYINPFLVLTLKTWDKCRTLLSKSTSLLASFMSQSWFPTAKDPASFPVWRKNNIYRFKDVLNGGKLITKQQLVQKHDVIILWFQYTQMYSMISKLFPNNSLILDRMPFEMLLDSK